MTDTPKPKPCPFCADQRWWLSQIEKQLVRTKDEDPSANRAHMYALAALGQLAPNPGVIEEHEATDE